MTSRPKYAARGILAAALMAVVAPLGTAAFAGPSVTVDLGPWHRAYPAERVYRIGAFKAEPGWVYRRWALDEVLPAPSYTPEHRIGDYGKFGLQAPPAGHEWVRYGPDALLVNAKTGKIAEAVYGVFA